MFLTNQRNITSPTTQGENMCYANVSHLLKLSLDAHHNPAIVAYLTAARDRPNDTADDITKFVSEYQEQHNYAIATPACVSQTSIANLVEPHPNIGLFRGAPPLNSGYRLKLQTCVSVASDRKNTGNFFIEPKTNTMSTTIQLVWTGSGDPPDPPPDVSFHCRLVYGDGAHEEVLKTEMDREKNRELWKLLNENPVIAVATADTVVEYRYLQVSRDRPRALEISGSYSLFGRSFWISPIRTSPITVRAKDSKSKKRNLDLAEAKIGVETGVAKSKSAKLPKPVSPPIQALDDINFGMLDDLFYYDSESDVPPSYQDVPFRSVSCISPDTLPTAEVSAFDLFSQDENDF